MLLSPTLPSLSLINWEAGFVRGVWQERGRTAAEGFLHFRRMDGSKTMLMLNRFACHWRHAHLWLTWGLNHGDKWEFYNIAKAAGYFKQWLLQHNICLTPEKIQGWERSNFRRGGEGRFLPNSMPAPKKFLVASTSLPMALGWGWNLSLYVGMLLGLLTLMLLLLWMLLKQLRNSVGKSTLQPVRSFRQPHFEQRFQHVLWKMGQFYQNTAGTEAWWSAWMCLCRFM